jgi:hypothetical protein
MVKLYGNGTLIHITYLLLERCIVQTPMPLLC